MTMTIAEATAVLTAPGQIFEVGDETVRGIPLNVWKNAPPSLRAVLEMSRGHGDQTFLVYEDERMTFEEHFRAAAHLALEWLRGRSLESVLGDFVFVGGYPAGIELRPEVVSWSLVVQGGSAEPGAAPDPARR